MVFALLLPAGVLPDCRQQITRALNIVFVSAEVAPWSKTGGLGDVVGGLPIELAKRGHKVLSIAPRYDQYADAWDTSVSLNIDGETVRFFHTREKGVDRVWVDHESFLAKVWGKTGAKLYGQKSGRDFNDNQKRFLLFCKAALQALLVLPFSPGSDSVMVCNDWHTAILPVLLKDVYQPAGQFLDTKAALCIHNIAFQGRFWRESFADLGLPASSAAKFEFEDGYSRIFTEDEPDTEEKGRGLGKMYKKINWLRAGILSADKILTVSPNYAAEIAANPQLGVELDEVLREVGGAEGIVNGMDVTDWNPAVDKFLDVKFDASTLEDGKALAKETLQAELGLDEDPSKPLFGFIGRLEEQKGVDILLAALPQIAQKGDVQVAILGTGRKTLEAQVKSLQKELPGVAGVVKFSSPLAHLITAGADFMLVPSRFEPCGLIQLHAMQYGTVPLVSSVGGLVDTVKEAVTGFHMGCFDPDDMLPADAAAVAETVAKAAEVFPTEQFKTMRARCISQELSWQAPAKKWEAVLEGLTNPSEENTQRKEAVTTPVQKVDDPELVNVA
ncbi:granule-bound starch synthase [Coccomyxa subellipsoidea C-169]|uniref:Starch synthase, chloroplastic/amyloplastic n=1 Tax=Coccomyxa subellipsoidea (strain C-169) TaxID=574566 RepID=I0YRZ0_COCSC|nr:granule-bound starch synthase [Coccomyxa subellipsoidea C-169]EIE21159.1 granule-bound starch synthase [Coccomyxa subellipsoidea C-169]|eukprot:XP_005645703.1 granule-bound starch synthase [Coccomyxa subellipsoidea C-169]